VAHEIRNSAQHEDCQGAFPRRADLDPAARRRGNRMRAPMHRRSFLTLLGGAAAAWPLAARAQQRERMRRIGMLIGLAADDPEGLARITGVTQGLQERGWTVGRNLRMEFRSAGRVPENYRKYAEELVALTPEIILSGGSAATTALQQATRTLPIV